MLSVALVDSYSCHIVSMCNWSSLNVYCSISLQNYTQWIFEVKLKLSSWKIYIYMAFVSHMYLDHYQPKRTLKKVHGQAFPGPPRWCKPKLQIRPVITRKRRGKADSSSFLFSLAKLRWFLLSSTTIKWKVNFLFILILWEYLFGVPT